MLKNFLRVFLILSTIIIFTACEKSDEINVKETEQREIISKRLNEESYEDIVSNTVQYGKDDSNGVEEAKEQRKFETIISCQDCFHNIGFVEKICEQNGNYFFERNKNENDEYDIFDWFVYVFDEQQKFKDIKEYNQPVLVNEGNLEIKKGQYIYILCSYNPDTETLPANSDQSYIYYMK